MPTRRLRAHRPGAMRHARRPPSHRIARGVALVVTALLTLTLAGTATALTRFQSNIGSASVEGLIGTDRPTAAAAPDPNDPHAGAPLNILLMGSDDRDGANGDIGGVVPGMRSDTTIVLHLSADRSRVDLVSIPRDTLVAIPACDRADGSSSKAQKGQFNAAFSIGGQSGVKSDAAACAWKTVEKNTGVRLDDYVVIDFAGFTQMVNALGGIPICIPTDLRSPQAELNLTAGQQILDGTTALAFARARYDIGDGSDTGRIGRQQQLLAAMVREVQSKNLLTDLPALLRFLGAATSSVTASPNLASIPSLVGLAFSLRATPGSSITFMTIPSAPAPSDRNRIVMTTAAAAVWANIAADRPIVAVAPVAPVTPTPGATAAPTTPVPTEVKTPGASPITASDVTALCG